MEAEGVEWVLVLVAVEVECWEEVDLDPLVDCRPLVDLDPLVDCRPLVDLDPLVDCRPLVDLDPLVDCRPLVLHRLRGHLRSSAAHRPDRVDV